MAKKVIIIDDSSSSLNFLKTAFAKSSWEVFGAQNAILGYQMIFDCAPDLIITDALMPMVGGFQFIRKIRENEYISKIPVIIYSVLDPKNAKYYIKEQNPEYFLQKDDNAEELLKLAQEVTEKHALDDDYKSEILMHENKIFLSSLNENKEKNKKEDPFEEEIKQETTTETIKAEEIILNEDELQIKFKENYDFSFSDEKIFTKIFSIISPLLKYDLFLINVFSYEKNKNCIFFDIKDVILSPIFQNQTLNKYITEEIILFKKYTPNLKMIINEEEFFSKIEFSFEYNGKNIGNIAYYSKEKNKWQNEENLRTIKNVLYNFFKARHINKSATNNKKDEIMNKYFINKIDLIKNTKFDNETKK